jgi:hypothetical protein
MSRGSADRLYDATGRALANAINAIKGETGGQVGEEKILAEMAFMIAAKQRDGRTTSYPRGAIKPKDGPPSSMDLDVGDLGSWERRARNLHSHDVGDE